MRSLLKKSIVTFVGLCVLWPQAATAQQTTPSAKSINCQVIGNKLKVVGRSGTCVVPVHLRTKFTLPRGATADDMKPAEFALEHDKIEGTFKVAVKAGTPAGTETVVKVEDSGYTITLVIYSVSAKTIKHRGWTLIHVTEEEAAAKRAASTFRLEAAKQRDRADKERDRADEFMAKNNTLRRALNKKDNALQTCQRHSAALDRKFEESEARRLEAEKQVRRETAARRQAERAKALRDHLASFAKELLIDDPDASQMLVPHPDDRTKFSHHNLDIDFKRARWASDWFLFHTTLRTRILPFRLAKSTVQTKDGRILETRFALPTDLEEPDEGIVARISLRKSRNVVIAVKLAGEESIDGLTLKLSGPDDKPLVTAQIPRYRDGRILVPVTEAEERAERLEKQRQQRARQVMVGVSGSVGAFWIADGLGASRLEVTDYRGLGVRLVKGHSEHFAFEIEIAGGITGNARFPGMTIDGMEGELTRSASFGRAGFGGILRYGDKVTPYARLGVAGQIARFDAAFTEAVDMDESSYEFSALVTTFGGGVQVRLGENWLLGVALSADTPLGGSDGDLFGRAFSFGGQVAYGW